MGSFIVRFVNLGVFARDAALTLALAGLLLVRPDGADASAAFPGPNGKISFVSNRVPGNLEVFAMNADGTGQTNLTNSPGYDSDPV